jgi:putative phosphoribosyl transferase
MICNNRRHAGIKLVQALEHYRDQNVIVLALPRGGVPIGYEVAHFLRAPLDILVVRKLGAPGHEELAIGALGPGHVVVLNQELIQMLGVSQAQLTRVIDQEAKELDRRLQKFRGNRPFPDISGKTVIIIDDGLATGSTALAAVQAVRKIGMDNIVLAIPVCARDSASSLRYEVDELVCLESPAEFHAVGLWYQNFEQTSDGEVVDLLQKAWKEIPNTPISSY